MVGPILENNVCAMRVEQIGNLKIKGSHQVVRDHAFDIHRDSGQGNTNHWGYVSRMVIKTVDGGFELQD